MQCTKPQRSKLTQLGRLHLAYFVTRILLFRALMAPVCKDAKSDPESPLSRYFTLAVAEGEMISQFVGQLTAGDLRAFWDRRKSYRRTDRAS